MIYFSRVEIMHRLLFGLSQNPGDGDFQKPFPEFFLRIFLLLTKFKRDLSFCSPKSVFQKLKPQEPPFPNPASLKSP